MFRLITRLLNLPTALRIRLYPYINRMILKAQGAVLGQNILIPGKVYLGIRGGKFA